MSSCRSSTPTPSAWRPSVAKGVDALTTDNTILAGYAAQPPVQGQAQGRRQDVLDGELRRRHQEGRHGDSASKINAALKKMVDDGAWQKAVDANLGPAGFKVDTAANPPKPDPCS